MMSLRSCCAFVLLLATPAVGFSPVSPPRSHGLQRPSAQSVTSIATFSPLFQKPISSTQDNNNDHTLRISKRQRLKNAWSRIARRADTLESAQLEDAQMAGIFGLVKTGVKKAHDPKTYFVLSLLAGLRWDWCFKSPFYWFGVAFCIKWYRARYVFKIPVWDRQPNWNNVITSKEQEKDLKAYTCKNCGSTIFIAKTREFFFAGDTGIGGLGCFSCGAKGKDNFIMDRDRIVEDVADEDDYFDYERPLDFVSRAERRKLLKEAQGDEEIANQLLVQRENEKAGVSEETEGEAVDVEMDAPSEEETSNDSEEEEQNPVEAEAVEDEEESSEEPAKSEETAEISDEAEPVAEEAPKPAPTPAPKPAPSPAPKPAEVEEATDDDWDVLGI